MKRIFLIFIISFIYSQSYAQETFPMKMAYQGYLTDVSGNPIDDKSVGITFRIYDTETGGNLLWEESFKEVAVNSGVFSVLIGGINPIPSEIFLLKKQLYLEIQINDNPPMIPRQEIVSTAFSFESLHAKKATFADEAKISSELKGPANDVECSECISSSEISPNVISTIHIKDAAITEEKISFNYASGVEKGGPAIDLQCSGCVDSKDIALSAIKSQNIEAGTINDAHISTGAVTSEKILNGDVKPEDVAFNYANSATKGGPAIDVACSGCIDIGEISFVHGQLSGLEKDDHPQYLLANGTRALSGNLNIAAYQLQNIVIHNMALAPSNPKAGQLFYDTTNKNIKFYDGVVWQDLGTAGVGLPSGSSGQTLRHDGTKWVANSFIFNNGAKAGIGTTTPQTAFDVVGGARVFGGLSVLGISTPKAPTVTPKGGTSNCKFGYKITAIGGTGETLPSAEGTVTNAYCDLTNTTYNEITWEAVGGAYKYKIYRTTTTSANSPENTTGLITVTEETKFNDIGYSATGSVSNIDTSGYVGIGTTTPTSLLEVSGQIKITGGSPGDGKVLTSDANGLATWETSVPKGAIIMYSGKWNFDDSGKGTGPLEGWALCNGQNGTPDLSDRFVMGTKVFDNLGTPGGANSYSLTSDQLPPTPTRYPPPDSILTSISFLSREGSMESLAPTTPTGIKMTGNTWKRVPAARTTMGVRLGVQGVEPQLTTDPRLFGWRLL